MNRYCIKHTFYSADIRQVIHKSPSQKSSFSCGKKNIVFTWKIFRFAESFLKLMLNVITHNI